MLNRKNKGISTFIATLLLMVLAVSAGVVIYAYTMGYLGGFGGTEQLGAMSTDSVVAYDSDNITAYVRNIGKSTLNITTVYVDGTQYLLDEDSPITDGNWTGVEDGNFSIVDNQLGEGQVTKLAIMDDGLSAGTTYEVKLIASDNTQTSFSVKAK